MYGIFFCLELLFLFIQSIIWWIVKQPFNISNKITWFEMIVLFFLSGIAAKIAKDITGEDSILPFIFFMIAAILIIAMAVVV